MKVINLFVNGWLLIGMIISHQIYDKSFTHILKCLFDAGYKASCLIWLSSDTLHFPEY